MSDQIQYYIREGDSERGPFSLGQMRSLWSNCQVNLATEYRTGDLDTWCPLGDIAELLEPAPSRQAGQAVVMAMAPASRARWIYIVLGIFLGCLGVHNFFARRYTTGFAQLLITLLLGWVYVGFAITWLWALIEIITVTSDGSGARMS